MLNSAEVVVRAAVIPKMVLSGVISPARAISDFHSETDDQGNKRYTISVGRQNLLPTEQDIHDFGCRVAAAANDGFEKANGRAPIRGEETQHYRGSYRLIVGPIIELSSDIFSLAVIHTPKPTLSEHCDIEMRRTASEFRRIEVSGERTSVIASLRLFLHDPSEHICECDADLAERFSMIRLVQVAPEVSEFPAPTKYIPSPP